LTAALVDARVDTVDGAEDAHNCEKSEEKDGEHVLIIGNMYH
jgi:hypothetical protein